MQDDDRVGPDGAGSEEDDGMDGAAREDAPGGRAASFDPTPYLRQLRGRGGAGQDYLDVKWRLLWLRREHPDAEILTEHVQIDQSSAIFKATVSLPTGGRATGYGSETAGDFGDFIEKAETKAIGRALNALGYGAQFGERGDDAEPAGPSPARPSPATPAPTTPRPRPVAPSAPVPTATAVVPAVGAAAAGAQVGGSAPSPIDIAAGRERAGGRGPAAAERPDGGRAQAGEPAPAPAPAPSGQDGGGRSEAELADYSWSAFWPWARGLGLNGPRAVEELIGRPTAGLTPAELRDLIAAARGGG